MAIAFKTQLGTNNNKTSGTTLVVTTTAAIAVGDLVIVTWAADNLASSGPSPTVTDSGGNSYNNSTYDYSGGSAGGGIAGGVSWTKATNAVASGGTVTLTLSGAVTAKAMNVMSFTGAEAGVGVNFEATLSGTAITHELPSVSAVGQLVLGHIAVEDSGTPTYDSDTLDGSWSAGIRAGTSGGGAAANVYSACQYKIVTGFNNQVWNLTVASTDTRSQGMVFSVAVVGPAYDAGTTTATSTVSATKGLIGHTGSDTEKSTHTLAQSFKPAHFQTAPTVISTHTLSRTSISRRFGSASISQTSTVSATGAKGPDAPVGSGSGSATSTSTVSATGKTGRKGSDTETSTSTVSVSSKRVAARSAGTTTSTHTLTATFKPAHFQAAPTLTQAHTLTAIGGRPGGAGSGSGGVIATHTVSASGYRISKSSGTVSSTSTVSVSGGRSAARSAGTITSTHTTLASFKPAHFQAGGTLKSTSTITVSAGRFKAQSAGTVVSTSIISRAGFRTSYGSTFVAATHTLSVISKPSHSQSANTVTAQHQVTSIGKTGRKGSGTVSATSSVFGSNTVQPKILNDANRIYIGAIPAIKVYLGSEQVWP